MFEKILVAIVESDCHGPPHGIRSRLQPGAYIAQGDELEAQPPQEPQMPVKTPGADRQPFMAPGPGHADAMVCENAQFVHGQGGPPVRRILPPKSGGSIDLINSLKLYINPAAGASSADLTCRAGTKKRASDVRRTAG